MFIGVNSQGEFITGWSDKSFRFTYIIQSSDVPCGYISNDCVCEDVGKHKSYECPAGTFETNGKCEFCPNQFYYNTTNLECQQDEICEIGQAKTTEMKPSYYQTRTCTNEQVEFLIGSGDIRVTEQECRDYFGSKFHSVINSTMDPSGCSLQNNQDAYYNTNQNSVDCADEARICLKHKQTCPFVVGCHDCLSNEKLNADKTSCVCIVEGGLLDNNCRCKEGYILVNNTCTMCPENTYSNVEQTECIFCPTNKHLPIVTDHGYSPPSGEFPLQECEGDCDNDGHCDEGLICAQRDSQYIGCRNYENTNAYNDFCVPVSYASTWSNSSVYNSNVCRDCPVNTTSIPGGPCTNCSLGKVREAGEERCRIPCSDDQIFSFDKNECICKPGTTTVNNTCAVCKTGHYDHDSNSLTQCRRCGTGKYQDEIAQTSCKFISSYSCPVGSYIYSNGISAPSCRLCHANTFNNMENRESCFSCPVGHFSLEGSTECAPCINLKAEYKHLSCCQTNSSTCHEIKTNFDTYCNVNTCGVYNLCDTGYERVDGKCQECPEGTYSYGGVCTAWTECGANQESTGFSATSDASCTDCPTGKTSVVDDSSGYNKRTCV